MKLSKRGSVTIVLAMVMCLLLIGMGIVEYHSLTDKISDQAAQLKLYKEEVQILQNEAKENISYKAMYECMTVERNALQKELDEIKNWSSLGQFVITYYWPGEDKYGRLTSTGNIAKEGKTIAVDPTVIPYGSIIKINGNEYVAEDCGGAIKGNKIDIFVENPKHQKYTVEIYIKKEN